MKIDADVLIGLITADATTPEAQARIAWRMSDRLWDLLLTGEVDVATCREFNNACQLRNDEGWPWVDNLWTRDEIIARVRTKYPEAVADDILTKLP